jgi:hypothetical protein
MRFYKSLACAWAFSDGLPVILAITARRVVPNALARAIHKSNFEQSTLYDDITDTTC